MSLKIRATGHISAIWQLTVALAIRKWQKIEL